MTQQYLVAELLWTAPFFLGILLGAVTWLRHRPAGALVMLGFAWMLMSHLSLEVMSLVISHPGGRAPLWRLWISTSALAHPMGTALVLVGVVAGRWPAGPR